MSPWCGSPRSSTPPTAPNTATPPRGALGQTVAGPLAGQVAMGVGYLQAGGVGALGTAIPFILPSLAMVLAVAYLYVRFQGLAAVESLFYGIAPGVMAIIAFAAVKLA